MAELVEVRRTVYFKGKDDDRYNGPVEMYAIDAQNAVMNHPEEYSFQPWDDAPSVNLPSGEPIPAVPPEWADLPASNRIALARKLGAQGVISGSKADSFIEGYLANKAGDAANDGPAPKTERPAAEMREQERSKATEEAETGKSVTNTAPHPNDEGQ